MGRREGFVATALTRYRCRVTLGQRSDGGGVVLGPKAPEMGKGLFLKRVHPRSGVGVDEPLNGADEIGLSVIRPSRHVER